MEINAHLKKYQPIIQTIGILILLVALVISVKQNQILSEELELAYTDIKNDNLPRFIVKIEQNSSNTLIDKIVFTSRSDKYILQKEEILLVNNTTPFILETFNGEVNTNKLKSELVSVLRRYYEFDTEFGLIYTTKRMSYPIAIKYKYESNGSSKDTVILYDYHFTTYYSDGNCKIKSEGLEFVKYLPSNLSNITRSLIKYNINNSFLSNFPNSIFEIKKESILKDTLLADMLSFVTYNLTFSEHNIVLSDSAYRSLYFYIPHYFDNDSLLIERNKLIVKILANLNLYDEEIKFAFNNILKEDKKFRKLSSSTNLKDIPYNSRTRLYINEYNEWFEVNSDLRSILMSKVEI